MNASTSSQNGTALTCPTRPKASRRSQRTSKRQWTGAASDKLWVRPGEPTLGCWIDCASSALIKMLFVGSVLDHRLVRSPRIPRCLPFWACDARISSRFAKVHPEPQLRPSFVTWLAPDLAALSWHILAIADVEFAALEPLFRLYIAATMYVHQSAESLALSACRAASHPKRAATAADVMARLRRHLWFECIVTSAAGLDVIRQHRPEPIASDSSH